MAGELVTVVGPAGIVQHGRADEIASKGLPAGYRVASPEEEHQYRIQAQHGGVGGMAAAAGAGALRGVTGGLSDVAIAEIGGDSARQTLSDLREANPLASVGGEVAGTIGGMAIPFSPARGIGLAGGAAEAALGGSRVLGAAARGVVEGGLYGTAAGVSELALDDSPVTGERMAVALGGSALNGVLFGGGLGAGFGLAGKALRGGGSLLERAIRRPSASAIEGAVEGQFGHAADGIGARIIRRLDAPVSGITGAQPGTLASLATREARSIAVDEGAIARYADDFTDSLTRARDVEEAVAQQFSGGFKREQVGRLMQRGNESQTITAARAVAADLRGKVDDALASGVDNRFFGKLRTQVDALEARMATAEKAGEDWVRRRPGMTEAKARTLAEGFNDDVFLGLDTLKRRIGRRAMKFANKGSHGLDPEQTLAWQSLRSMYDDTLRPVLESTQLWGKAGAAQAAVNAPWKRLLDVKFGAGTTRGFESLFTTKTTSWDGAKWIVDRKKVQSFLDSITDPAEHEGLGVLEDWLTRNQQFVDTAKQHLALGPAESKAADGLAGTIKSLRTTRDKVVEAATLRNQLKKLEAADSKGNLLASAAGYALGAGMLGPAGGIGLALLGALTKPGATIRKLAAIEQLTAGYGSQVARGVAGIFRGAVPAAVRGAIPASGALARSADRRRRYEEREEQLRDVARNRDAATTRLTGLLVPVRDQFPVATARAVERVMAGADYLHAHLPTRSSDRYPLSPPRAPSRTDLDAFERRTAAVDDPIGSLTKELGSGRLSPETIDAVKTVWPQVYDDVTAGMMQEMTRLQADGQTIPYRARLAISALVGPAADPTLEPTSIAYVQALFDAEPDMSQPVQGAAEVPNLSAGFETDAQRLARER